MRTQRFTFLCTTEERFCLEQLAVFYHRTKGDTVRLLIKQAHLDVSKDTSVMSKCAINQNSMEKSHDNQAS